MDIDTRARGPSSLSRPPSRECVRNELFIKKKGGREIRRMRAVETGGRGAAARVSFSEREKGEREIRLHEIRLYAINCRN